MNRFVIFRHWERREAIQGFARGGSGLLRRLCLLTMTALFMFYVSPAHAVEPAPGAACATAQQFTTVGGVETSGAVHMMICQGGTWKSVVSANASGEVTALGNQSCTTGDFLKYDGTKFICTTGTCGDTTPTVFALTDVSNQALLTLITSNIVQVSGLGCTVNASITGEGSPQYRICSDSLCSTVVQDWTSGASQFANSNYVQMRLTTAPVSGDTFSATILIGNVADVWDVSTDGDCSSSPAVGTVCADGTVYAGVSPDTTVPMYVTRCDAGMSWNGSDCTGTRFTLTWNNGTSNWISTGYTNSATGEANTVGLAGLADIGADYVAAEYCFGLDDGNGNTDWYLPARQELAVMESGKNAIAHFDLGGSNYWSSSENNSTNAWRQRFSDGFQSSSNKNNGYAVRCARR